MATTVVVGRATVEVMPRVAQGAGAQIGQDLGASVPANQVGQQIGQDMSAGVAQAGGDAGKGFGEKMKGGLNIASAGIIAGGAAAVAGLTAIGDTFDGVVDTIRAGTGATGDALDSLVNDAKEVAKVTPASFDAIGPVVADLNTRLGLTGKTLQTVSSQVLEAGRVMGQELDVNALTGAFSAFGIEGENVVGAMDKVFVASQASGVGMNELASAAAGAAPAMKTLGFSFEETVGLVGTLSKAGIDAGTVTGGMNKALVNLAKAGEKPAEAFKRIVGELDGFVKAGDDANASKVAMELFGAKGANNFLNALKSGKVNLADLSTVAGQTGDTILGVGEDTADFAESWQKFINKMMISVEPLASKVFGMIGEGLDMVTPKIEEAMGWMQENIETVKTIAMVVGGFAAGILILNGALTVYNVIVGTVQAVTSVWTGVQWLLNTALLANPITWVVIAIVAFVAAIVIAYNNVGWFKDAINGLWSAVVSGVTGFVGWITGVALPAIGGFFTGIGTWIIGAGKIVGEFFQFILVSFGGFLVGAWEGLKGVAAGIGDFFAGIFAGVGTGFNSAVAFLGNGIDNILSFFGRMGKAIGDVFGNIGRFVGDTFKNLVGIIKGAVNVVISTINAPIRAINGLRITVPGWVPGIGGASWAPSLATIPSFGTGGIIKATPGGSFVRVAEKGKNEVIMNQDLNDQMVQELRAARNADTTGNGKTIQNSWKIEGYQKSAGELAWEINRVQKWDW